MSYSYTDLRINIENLLVTL